MRRHRDHWTRRVTRSRLAAIHAALEAGAAMSVVYGEYKVAQTGISLRAFQQYAQQRKVGLAPLTDEDMAQAAQPAVTVDDAIAATVDAMTLALRDQPTLAQASMALSALVAERKRQSGAERERLQTELLEAKLKELRARQEAALGAVQASARLSAEQVAEIRSKVLGL